MPGPALTVPAGLDWWRTVPGGADWLTRLPQIVEECASRWSLRLGPPFPAEVSLVVPADLPDGTRAVLKINFPEAESEREPEALAYWEGDGAVRLLCHDHDRRALLVERCEPGTTLWGLADEQEANRIAAGLPRRLWRPAPAGHGFRRLSDEAARWVAKLPALWNGLSRPFERWLLDEAVWFLRNAGPSQGKQVVLHQDFHGGNVLRAQREPWLAIDPKPLVGERELDVASLLRDRREDLVGDPRPQARVQRRLDQLADELGLDRGRMRGWGIAHALAWSYSPEGLLEDMVSCARWLAAAR